MCRNRISFGAAVVFLAGSFLVAQQTQTVPHLLRYSFTVAQLENLESPVKIELAIYAVQSGGEPLWRESQTVTSDNSGRVSVLLGAVTPDGVPDSIFSTGEARWVGVTPEGSAEQPRALLSAVAYSLKSLDADTLGGHPVSDFKLKDGNTTTAAVTQIQTSNGILGGGTGPTVSLQVDANYLEALGNSLYAQKNAVVSSLSGTSGVIVTKSGTSYAATLDANYLVGLGNSVYAQTNASNTFRSNQFLGPTGTATASSGYNSYAQRFIASAYNTANAAAETFTFGWQAETAGNNTAGPSSALHLLYGAGASTPVETGLSIASNGVLTFAPGQTFPSSGTITGVTAGADLTGGGTSGNVTLNLDTHALQATNDARYAQTGAANSFSGANTFSAPATFASQVTIGGSSQGSATASFGSSNGGTFEASIGNSAVQAMIGQVVSTTAAGFADTGNVAAGVWTDAGSDDGTEPYGALLATADNNYAGYFASYGGYATVEVENEQTAAGQIALEATDGDQAYCRMFYAGNFQESISCTGTFASMQPLVTTGRTHEFYAPQATENWMEDYGSGHLAAGNAIIELDPDYRDSLESGEDSYHVFLTPDGDCKGLYVASKTATSFEVRELGGGTANLAFDYKIVGHRRGMANIRMRDVTDEEQQRRATLAAQRTQRDARNAPAKPVRVNAQSFDRR